MPFAASLSRSMIQQTTGGRTQLASMICAAILTVVLVSFAPVFEPLPRCILASLIVVALKGILLQVKDIVKIWHMSTLDGIVWVATYVTVILVEIDVGLLVGLTVSIVTILFRGIRPLIYPLSRLPYTDIYVESTRYGKRPSPIEIHEEKLEHYISKSCLPGRKGEPASLVKAGRGWHTLVETRPIELPMNPRISTFAVSYVPLMDIHKVAQIKVTHRFLLCPVVGSTGRYKPARSDPCWVIVTSCTATDFKVLRAF
ncbi:hypothetical protein J6590_074176 [Homalodisca vitripennis]|nr:hypothetical protein J6590_074176 [Homalodisca vitripennis]